MNAIKTERRHNYSRDGWEGNNYQPYMDITTIAKTIRKELKRQFPDCKFSVTTGRFSGGQDLNISLMSAPFPAILKKHTLRLNEFKSDNIEQYAQINEYAFNCDYNDTRPLPGWNNGSQLSPEAWHVMKRVSQLANSFNYDDSDSQIDYFDVNFYLHLQIGKWNKPFVETRNQ